MRRLFASLALLLALATPARAQITIPNSFNYNTVADQDLVNANFTQLGNLALNRSAGTMTGTLTARTITAAADATYAIGDNTHRFTNAFFSGTVTANAFSGFVTGALTLLHQGSGSTTNAAAETVDTYALASQLTAKDKLLIVVTWRSGSGITTAPIVTNATDGVTLIGLNNNSNLAALATVFDVGVLDPSLETNVDHYVGLTGTATFPSTTQGNGNVVYKRTNRVAAYTGAWSIALGHGGVANPGTTTWEWAIYKMAGS